MTYQRVNLGEICDFLYGDGLPEAQRKGGAFPVYGSNGIVGWHDRAMTKGKAIIIGRKGSLGEVHFSETPCWPIDTTYYVQVTKIPCDLNWFYYMLKALDLTRLNKSAAVPGLNRDDAYREEIPLYPLSKQEHIATILRKADRLRLLYRTALELSSIYLQATFLEMFYRNADNAWPEVSIELLAKNQKNAIRTGPFGSQLLHSEFVDKGIAVLGIDNAVQNRFSWGVRRFITEEKYQQLKRYTVFPGDVIITIMGTPGRCAVIPKNFPLAINTKHLCCITLDQNQCSPEYLKYCFLTHPAVLRQLNVSERGAVMPGLNMEIIKDLIVSLPPLSLQEKFVGIYRKFGHLETQQREAARQADHLFQTLLHQAFQGELEPKSVLLPGIAGSEEADDIQSIPSISDPSKGRVYQLPLPVE